MMPERYRRAYHSEHRRRRLAEDARRGDMIAGVMLEHDIDWPDAVDFLARLHGLPPYRKRQPATVIDLAEVRRLIAEAETTTNGEGDAA